MKYKIKLTALAVAAAVLLAGCSATSSSSKAQTSSAQNSTASPSVAQASETGTLTGKVTAVEDGSITVETGTMQLQTPGEDKGDNGGGAPQGESSDDSHTAPPQGNGQQAPSGSEGQAPEAPSGSAPSRDGGSDKGPGGNGGMGGFTSDGGTLTIMASDGLTITKNGESAAFSDIVVGDLLQLTGIGEGSNFVTTGIEILSIGGEGQQGGPGGQGGVDSVGGSTTSSSQQ